MATVNLQGNPFAIAGNLPAVGDTAPALTLTGSDLADVTLADFPGKKKLISIFPSVDTPVCALSTKRFNDHARDHDDVVMLMVSADLPFALKRFCGNEGLDNVRTLSSFRNPQFGTDYGVVMTEGPMAGILARAVLVLDANDTVIHSELVSEIADEPDYNAALAALK